MKPFVTTAVAAFIATSFTIDVAEARPSTKSYPCSALQDLIEQRGAMIMDTKSRNVYKRFVANRSYCTLEEKTKSHRVPAADGTCKLRICYSTDPFAKRRP